MKISQKLYQKLSDLIPNLRELKTSKESYLLRSMNHVPVNVCIEIQTEEKTGAVLCAFPLDETGEIVPAPYLEIEFNHLAKQAIPTLYADSLLKLERSTLLPPSIKQLDFTVYSWLTMLQRLAFKLESSVENGIDNSPTL